MAQVYWFYANKEIKNENWDKAIKISEEALKWDPYLGEVYYDIGKILEIKKFYGVSLEYFEKAAKYIDHPDLPQDLALNYLKKGQLDEAAIKLKQAISYQENEKSMLPLYAELGNTYLKLKRYKPAEIVLKDALKIDPNFINAHYGLAGAYLNQNKIEETLVELQKVIELAPDSQEAKNAQTIMQQIAQEKLKAQPEEKGDSENK
jgi:tetratricopeptide (TPR) repeat protein